MSALIVCACEQYLQSQGDGRRCLGLELEQMVSDHIGSGIGTWESVTTPSALNC